MNIFSPENIIYFQWISNTKSIWMVLGFREIVAAILKKKNQEKM